MIVYFKGLKTPYVAAIDIEHDQGHMIQFAGILMKRVGEDLLGSGQYQYVLPFELISVLLLACIIGGIMIARKR